VSYEDFYTDILKFLYESVDLTKPIKLLGYNLATFSKPFFENILKEIDVDIPISSNLLDAYPLATTLWGCNSIYETVNMFCRDECLREEEVMRKTISFVNIFKQTRKIWNQKILNAA
jgi:hypothetical protein